MGLKKITFFVKRKNVSGFEAIKKRKRRPKWQSRAKVAVREPREIGYAVKDNCRQSKQKKKEKEKRERVSLTYSHTLTNSNPGQVRRRKKKKWPSEPRDRLRSRRQSKRNLDAVSPVFWMQKLPISKREIRHKCLTDKIYQF